MPDDPHPIPETFTLTVPMQEAARWLLPGINVNVEFVKFAAYHRHAGILRREWRRAWRGWVLSPRPKLMTDGTFGTVAVACSAADTGPAKARERGRAPKPAPVPERPNAAGPRRAARRFRTAPDSGSGRLQRGPRHC
mgnify:CR=1 FL=1